MPLNRRGAWHHRDTRRRLLHLSLLVVALPATVTYLYVNRILGRTDLCFVADQTDVVSIEAAAASSIVAASSTAGAAAEDAPPPSLSGVYARAGGGSNAFGGDSIVFARVRSPSPPPTGPLSRLMWRMRVAWPSSTTLSERVSATASRYGGDSPPSSWERYHTNKGDVAAVLVYGADGRTGNGGGMGWCAKSVDPGRRSSVHACNDGGVWVEGSVDARTIFPPSGTWRGDVASPTPEGDDSTRHRRRIRVSCPPTPPTPASSAKARKRSKRRQANVDQVLNRPTTTLLLLLNIYLAFAYWNRRTDPSSVGKSYQKIIRENELWRGFTGATAHFDLLHLGFNMMSLYALGEALEDRLYDSITFFNLNVSLVVWTTVVMMAIAFLRIRFRGEGRVAEQYSVGYSGVLFAWMAVSTLELPSSCPIPFLPDVCFETHSLGPIKWNASPVVQLIIAQVILPRASFAGHLAGIICGFVLHWRAMRTGVMRVLWAPQVLIPAVLLLHFALIRRLIPIERHVDMDDDDDNDVDDLDGVALDGDHLTPLEDGSSPSSPSSSPGRRRRTASPTAAQHRNEASIVLTWKVLLAASVASLPFVDLTTALSQLLSACLFYLAAVRAYRYLIWTKFSPLTKKDRAAEATGSLLRAYFISGTLCIASDGMTVGGWIAAHTYVDATINVGMGLVPAAVFASVRIAVNIICLIVSAKLLGDTNGVARGGPFDRVFGYVFSQARGVGDALIVPDWNAFDGRGVALGSHGSGGGEPDDGASGRTTADL